MGRRRRDYSRALVEKFFYLSDQWANLDRPRASDFPILRSDFTFERDEVLDADYIYAFGELGNNERAAQIARVFKAAVRRGRVVVVAYPTVIQGPLALLADELIPGRVDRIPNVVGTTCRDPAFREYIDTFGTRSVAYFQDMESETLASIPHESLILPTAICHQQSGGAVYVVPVVLAGFHDDFLSMLHSAVVEHRSASAEGIPGYLSTLRVHGEEGVLAEVAEAQTRLSEAQGRARELERFRLLVGPRSGQPLEDIVIEALNVVLADTGHHAEDRRDIGGEDFWVVNDSGDVAYAEVKGVGRNVSRNDVAQADAHRDAFDREDADLIPALLVVNIFKSSQELSEKQMAVPSHAIVRAAQVNVLILRGFDLYKLVSRKLAGEDAGHELLTTLASGGGWLRVDDGDCELVTA